MYIFFAAIQDARSYGFVPLKVQTFYCLRGLEADLQIRLFKTQAPDCFHFVYQIVKKQFNGIEDFIIGNATNNKVITLDI